eukprot:CAMPEP_0195067614 /NCGR_PEP_ID=MMETSP0448-20130528/12616_1 /TAXON_ID=66468 /ORGANISM="Heterocapsa triquestra, Strain CCMP 448" /LENGTH=69 /DNA_ID=CAMNT_0040099045 /DNA_START=15 /DNA_END=220 /DNA_ORIENTATION=+
MTARAIADDDGCKALIDLFQNTDVTPGMKRAAMGALSDPLRAKVMQHLQINGAAAESIEAKDSDAPVQA